MLQSDRRPSLVVFETQDGYEFVDGEEEEEDVDDAYTDRKLVHSASFPDWAEWGDAKLQDEHLYEETSPFQKFGVNALPRSTSGDAAHNSGDSYEYSAAPTVVPAQLLTAAASAHLPKEMAKALGDVAAQMKAQTVSGRSANMATIPRPFDPNVLGLEKRCSMCSTHHTPAPPLLSTIRARVDAQLPPFADDAHCSIMMTSLIYFQARLALLKARKAELQSKGYDGETELIHNDNVNVFPKLPRAPAGRRCVCFLCDLERNLREH